MENIHILPTDKPSRLGRFIDTNNLVLKTFYELSQSSLNIFITSDEEIKDGDLCIDTKRNIIFQSKRNEIGTSKKIPIIICTYEGCYIKKDCKKIILTTDQDLIKDDVQAIDDEFLVWFVKNPSCESVEIDIEKYVNLTSNPIPIYKIIIPQEEQCTCKLGEPYNNACCKVHGSIPKEEPKQIKCYCGHTITCDCEPLQETIEEAAEMYIQSKNPQWTPYHKQSFKDGAKWQEQRMFSEEDLIQLLNFVSKEYNVSNGIGWFHDNESIEDISSNEVLNRWFEQFKNKFV
jgi:hypothetical protein